MTHRKNVWRAKHDNGWIYFIVRAASTDNPCVDIRAASSNHIRYKAEVLTDIGEATWSILKKSKRNIEFESNNVKICCKHFFMQQYTHLYHILTMPVNLTIQ